MPNLRTAPASSREILLLSPRSRFPRNANVSGCYSSSVPARKTTNLLKSPLISIRFPVRFIVLPAPKRVVIALYAPTLSDLPSHLFVATAQEGGRIGCRR